MTSYPSTSSYAALGGRESGDFMVAFRMRSKVSGVGVVVEDRGAGLVELRIWKCDKDN